MTTGTSNQDNNNYAHLPEELLVKILENATSTIKKINSMYEVQDEPVEKAIEFLRDNDMVRTLSENGEFSDSLIAVDGAMILEKMAGTDLLLSVAVGVEGLTEDQSKHWGDYKNQYYQWQTALPHSEANARLAQGVMFLMELSVLSSADYDIRIMDGTHFTPILKINSMLSAQEESAGKEYSDALRGFLQETYEKIIPDIPDIITGAMSNPCIIALAKYSSSRDVIAAYLNKFDIKIDDKTFFSLALKENEYLLPLSVGQSIEEREKIWNELHIACNLDIPEKDSLNVALKKAIYPLTTKGKTSKLYYSYFRPYKDGPSYRIDL